MIILLVHSSNVSGHDQVFFHRNDFFNHHIKEHISHEKSITYVVCVFCTHAHKKKKKTLDPLNNLEL